MSGTPVITTDFGAFNETVKQNVTGFRCRTFREFVQAAEDVENLKPSDCREWAENFTLDKVAPMYKRYFSQILGLVGKGWYS
jgi:glycosyltransferase involved in cell wall biosynthesis